MTSVRHQHWNLKTGILSFFIIALTCTPLVAWANTPTCPGPDLTILSQVSTNSLVEIQADAIEPRTLLRFVNPTAELLTLNVFDSFLLPPSAALPTGFQGRIWDVQINGNELTLSAAGSRLAGTIPLNVTPAFTTEPTDFDQPRECFTLLPDGSLVDSDADGAGDGGAMAEQCNTTNGNDYSFSVELTEGVTVNGLLTAAPFDFEGELELDALDIVEARVISEGRVSFTGEIRADADTLLPEGQVGVGSALLGKYTLKMGELSNIATLTATLTADVFVGACGSISAGAHTGVTTTSASTLGIEWDSGAPRIIASTADVDLKVSPPQLDSDVSADVTLYGGVVLRLNFDLEAAGLIPLAGIETQMTALGSARVEVNPAADPWWQVSGRPEVYVDMYPQLLTGDLTQFDFNIINPNAQVFFTANDEFPFTASASASSSSSRSTGTREAGTALRWSRAFQSEDFYATADTIPLLDGGALLLANSAQFGSILRTDYLGNRVWQRRVEGTLVPESAFELPSGQILISGTVSGALWLMLLDQNGDSLWSREYSAPDGDIDSASITGVAGNDILVAGLFTNTTGAAEQDPWAARIDSGGGIVWANYYGQVGLNEQILGVTGTSDNGLMLVGDTGFTPPGPLLPGGNTYTLRLNSDGSVRWSNVWASSTGERLLAATQAPDGSFIAVGSTGGTNQNAAPRGLVIRYDSDAITSPVEPRYVRAFGGAFTFSEFVFDEFVDVVNTGQGFTLAGMSGLANEQKLWLASLAERGDEPDLTWSVYHDGLDEDTVVRLHDVGDGYLIGGHTKSFANGALDEAVWLSRLPYEAWLGWNTDSNATATYTPILEDEPPSYPLVSDSLNITGVEDTTALEQQVPLNFTLESSTTLALVPIGFPTVELVKEPLPVIDSDSDGIADEIDNCTLVANTDQRDTNQDGYGNSCDADLNNDGTVNFIDLSILSGLFLMTDDDADLNGDGIVNFIDISLFSQQFLAPPGPSGIAAP